MHHSPLILPFAPVRMRRFSDIAVLKPLELSNYGSIINTRGRWLLIGPYDITHLCTGYVNTVKVGRQGQWKRIFILK